MLLKNKTRLSYVAKGLFIALITTIMFLVFFSLLLRFTSLSESKQPLFNNIIMIISIVISSIYSTIKIKEKGWIIGGIVGFLYYLIIILFNFFLIKGDTSNIIFLSKLILSTVIGTISGVIGINLS